MPACPCSVAKPWRSTGRLLSGASRASLARWRLAAQLSHPHLLRLLDFGRCRLEDSNFLYVVMEHAELARLFANEPPDASTP